MGENAIAKGVKNIKYSFAAQFIVMCAGILKTLLVPSFLSVESYGYWQIYLFYISYIGFFYLGFNDGILLKYGKYDYANLPFGKIRSSMYLYIVMLILFSVGTGVFATAIDDTNKRFVILIIATSILMYGIYGVLIYVFLITNQIKRYSIYMLLDQVVVLLAAVIMLIMKNPDYKILVYFTTISKLILVIAMIIQCKEILFGKADNVRIGFGEFVENIKFGVMLMLAQIMSMLLTGLGRIFVEYFGDVSQYAYYTFGISVVNLVMVCVTAAATVMYPTLSRVDESSLKKYFNDTSRYVTFFNLFAILAYFPAHFFVKLIFPQYTPMLSYLFLFFAMLTWQAKVSIVTNSYFRVLRKEKQMLVINAVGVVFFLVIGFPMVLISNSIASIALCTFLTTVFIQIISEVYLRKNLGIKMNFTLLHDVVINAVFILCCITLPLLYAAVAYVVFICIYLFFTRKILISDIKSLRSLLRK